MKLKQNININNNHNEEQLNQRIIQMEKDKNKQIQSLQKNFKTHSKMIEEEKKNKIFHLK
jgi:hypothetical protein